MGLKKCKKTTQAGLPCKGYAGTDGLCGPHAKLKAGTLKDHPHLTDAFADWLRAGLKAGYVSAEVALGIALER